MTDDLFSIEQTPEGDMVEVSENHGHSVYIPLNRHNLIPVVSTGLIRPARAYTKYYEDVLGLRDDLIPFFRTAPGREVTDYCASEGANSFPVILELPEDTFTPEELSAGAIARPVPSARLTAVHCRSDVEAKELVAHTWENASLGTLSIDVHPELFSPDGQSLNELKQTLLELPHGDDGLFERLNAASRLTGGLLAVAGLGEEQRYWAESLLSHREIQETTPGLGLIHRALLNASPSSGEERLLTSMIHVLVRLRFPSRESTEQLLGIYRTQAAEDFPEDGRIQKTVERAQHVLIRHDIRPGDDSSAPVSFGLLLHALRNRLSELTADRPDWSAFFEAGKPCKDTLVIARFLTGMRTGRHRLDTADRLPELDALAAIWEGDAAVNPDEPLLACLRQQKVAVKTAVPAAPEQVVVEIEVPVAPQLEAGNPQQLEPSPAVLLEATGQENQVEVLTDHTELVHIPAPAEQSEDFKVAVCKLRGWTELIGTQVQLNGTSSLELIPGRGSSMSLLLPHDVIITRIIRDEAQYILRLEANALTQEEFGILGKAQLPEPVKRRKKTSSADSTGTGRRKKKGITPQ